MAQLLSCDLGSDPKRRPLLQNHVTFAPEVGLDQAAPIRWRRAACLGTFSLPGSELGWPRLSPLLMVTGNIRGDSCELLASVLTGRGFPRTCMSHHPDPTFPWRSPLSLTFSVSGADLLLVSIIHFSLGRRLLWDLGQQHQASWRVWPTCGPSQEALGFWKKASPGPVKMARFNLLVLPHGLY